MPPVAIYDILKLQQHACRVIRGKVYNKKGHTICGVLNQHDRPCHRIGRCPFHYYSVPVCPANVCNGAVDASGTAIPSDGVGASGPDPGGSTGMLTPPKKEQYKHGWTKQEHFLFLQGLQTHGRGAWKQIAGDVRSRTATQVQSHAQKFFLRQKQTNKNKRSIHDLTLDSPEIAEVEKALGAGRGPPPTAFLGGPQDEFSGIFGPGPASTFQPLAKEPPPPGAPFSAFRAPASRPPVWFDQPARPPFPPVQRQAWPPASQPPTRFDERALRGHPALHALLGGGAQPDGSGLYAGAYPGVPMPGASLPVAPPAAHAPGSIGVPAPNALYAQPADFAVDTPHTAVFLASDEPDPAVASMLAAGKSITKPVRRGPRAPVGVGWGGLRTKSELDAQAGGGGGGPLDGLGPPSHPSHAPVQAAAPPPSFLDLEPHPAELHAHSVAAAASTALGQAGMGRRALFHPPAADARWRRAER